MIQGTYQVVVGIAARVAHLTLSSQEDAAHLSSGSWHNCWGEVHLTQFPQKDVGQLASVVGKITRVQYMYLTQFSKEDAAHLTSIKYIITGTTVKVQHASYRLATKIQDTFQVNFWLYWYHRVHHTQLQHGDAMHLLSSSQWDGYQIQL